jgi:rod shape-determining protein MreC
VVLSFLLISVDHKHQHLAALRAGLSVVIYPIQYAVSLPVRMVDAVAETLATHRSLLRDNQDLRKENLLLRSRGQKFAALESENRRLRALLDSTAELGEDVVVADVLAIETTAAKRQIVINKGSLQHVYIGQPIADAHGILGQVVEVGRFSSTAILITDARHAIPVQINRNGLRAIASGGDTNEELSLSFVPNNADVAVGDLVVSSGLDHRFPAGYPVGEITGIDSVASEPFAHIRVKPSAHVGRAREVLLVWPRSPAPALPAARPSVVVDDEQAG